MNKLDNFEKFFKGELDDPESINFFNELSNNPELRVELKSFLSVSKLVLSAKPAFNPSINSKAKIFEKAGFALPTGGLNNSVSQPNHTDTKQLYKKEIRKNIRKGFFYGSVVTALIMLFLYNYPSSEDAKMTYIDKKEIANNSNANNNSITIPNSSSISTANKHMRHLDKKNLANFYTNRSQAESDNLNKSKNIIDKIQASNISIKEQNFVENIHYESYAKTNNNTNSEHPQIDLFSDLDKGLDFAIEVKNSFNWHSTYAKSNPQKISPFNNFNLSALYTISKNIKIGIDLKQETFMTEFTGLEADGKLYKYYQQPNFTTYSLFTRVYPFEIYKLKPFAQIGLGVNTAGYTAKPLVGLEYKLMNNLSFIAEFEYSIFWFSHNSNWFNTNKTGISYGLSYKF